jgi:ATP-dependent DNA ligase
VIDATASIGLPVVGGSRAGLTIAGRDGGDARGEVAYFSVAPGFMSLWEIPVIEGRDFAGEDREGAVGAILINETAARLHWPAGGAVGARIWLGSGGPDDGAEWMRVIGIVADVRQHGPVEAVLPTMYGSTAQFSWPNRSFTVRVAANAPPLDAAAPLDDDPSTLGAPGDWIVEWKWDGIRAQLIRRGSAVHLWSRGEELITQRFPDVAAAATHLPEGTVLDGEILAFRDGRPLPFSALQQRIGRQKQVAQMARQVPVVFMAYDLLEEGGLDIRDVPLHERRRRLDALLGPAAGVLRLSPVVTAGSWTELPAQRDASRERGVEGLMIKRAAAPYGVGRRRGEWWKWKIDPYTIDAVLIYAQPGSGKRASLLTDYTFGVWHEGALVPVAKAYSGLTNEEIGEMDRWIRRHTVERYGPVRHLEPVHVFELGFEGIARSPRHRSGIAVRFPRMLRWRRDKPAAEADTLDTVTRLLESVEGRAAR